MRTLNYIVWMGLFCLVTNGSLTGQPTPFEGSGTNCESAMILCTADEMDGLLVTLEKSITYNAPYPLCDGGGVPANPVWIGFYAGCTAFNLTIHPYYLTKGKGSSGIQAVIYRAQPGSNPCPRSMEPAKESVVCFVEECVEGPVQLHATGLVRGDVYFLMINGCFGTHGQVLLQMDTPCGEPEPFSIQGDITLMQEFCVGNSINMHIPEQPRGVSITWTFDEWVVNEGPENDFYLTLTAPGTYQICASLTPNCPFLLADEICTTLDVYHLTPIPDTTYRCKADHPQAPCGIMDIMLKSHNGCDSMVVLNIDCNGSTFTEGEELFVCPGGDVFYEGSMWTCEDAGLQEVRYSRVNAPVCDSVISFLLTCLAPEVKIDPPLPLTPGDTAVLLDGSQSIGWVQGSTITWEWEAFNGGMLSGPINESKALAVEEGMYCLTMKVTAWNGTTHCTDVGCVTVEKGRTSSAKNISGQAKCGLEVWPQPAGEFVWVKSKCNHSYGRITVWNSLGVNMVQNIWPTGVDAMRLDIASWPAGMYYLQVFGKEGVGSEVVIVSVN